MSCSTAGLRVSAQHTAITFCTHNRTEYLHYRTGWKKIGSVLSVFVYTPYLIKIDSILLKN